MRAPARAPFRSSVQPLEPGNIDIFRRPRVKNRDGSISTVRTISIGVDGKEYLIPTVSDDGRIMSDEEATRQFERTGRHLGAFRTPAEATRYAQELHRQQEQLYAKPRRGLTIERNNNPGALRIPGSMKFQKFPSAAHGIKAQERLLGRYMKRGKNTVASIIETYAPRASRGGDNTDAQVNNYIGYVARRLGIGPSEEIGAEKLSALAGAMREFETGRRR